MQVSIHLCAVLSTHNKFMNETFSNIFQKTLGQHSKVLTDFLDKHNNFLIKSELQFCILFPTLIQIQF